MPAPNPAGYSGTPLVKKLGYKPGRAYLDSPPADYRALLGPVPDGVEFVAKPTSPLDFVHLFT